MNPAIGLLEFESIARGIEAGDAMAKRSPLDVLRAGTAHPGKYLVLVGGLTADVEEALAAGRSSGMVTDELFLPDVHPDVVASVGGLRRVSDEGEALGVVETMTVAAVIRAADAGVKAARVAIRERVRPGTAFLIEGTAEDNANVFNGAETVEIAKP